MGLRFLPMVAGSRGWLVEPLDWLRALYPSLVCILCPLPKGLGSRVGTWL